jgi:RNA ligase
LLKISQLLSVDALDAFVKGGTISERHHPSAPLRLYDYTAKAQYERIWTPETLACRGLIVHDGGTVWARPLPKFFNASEHATQPWLEPLPIHEPFTVFDKLDGSLGIAYRDPNTGEIALSTRGSFESEQCLHATKTLREKYPCIDASVGERETWLFEIIYPRNRIVVDYGDTDDVILLAVLDTDTGRDLPMPDQRRWPGHRVTEHANLTDWVALESASTSDVCGADGEGYVVRFASGLRAKVKFADYVRLHRLVTGVSSVVVWEHLADGRGLDDLIVEVPDEFYNWVRATATSLVHAYEEIEEQCKGILDDPQVDRGDRKATAQFFANQRHRAVLFKMLDGKAYDSIIWRAVKPTFEKPFRIDSDS